MRKLVSFRRIFSVEPHPNADKLELAIIDGWKCIVPKGVFNSGDMVIYFEIDSVIPVLPEFEFLRSHSYIKKDWLPKGEGFRIKTLKLRGEISQGLVMPIDEGIQELLNSGVLNIGDDLSSVFGVVKYDPPEPDLVINTDKKSNFPEFIPKTKQDRVQNISDNKLLELMDDTFEVTRKYHGMSITIYARLKTNLSIFEKAKIYLSNILGIRLKPIYRYGVCSHHVEYDINNDGNLFVQFALNSRFLHKLKDYVENRNDLPELAIQAELCGPGIQKNHHSEENVCAYVFDIYDIKEQKYLLPAERHYMFEAIYGTSDLIKHALVELMHFRLSRINTLDNIFMLGNYKLPNGKFNEGLVWKSCQRDFSFKAINNNFLLENK